MCSVECVKCGCVYMYVYTWFIMHVCKKLCKTYACDTHTFLQFTIIQTHTHTLKSSYVHTIHSLSLAHTHTHTHQIVLVLKKEVAATSNGGGEGREQKDVTGYRQSLVRTLHQCSVRFAAVAPAVVPLVGPISHSHTHTHTHFNSLV